MVSSLDWSNKKLFVFENCPIPGTKSGVLPVFGDEFKLFVSSQKYKIANSFMFIKYKWVYDIGFH